MKKFISVFNFTILVGTNSIYPTLGQSQSRLEFLMNYPG